MRPVSTLQRWRLRSKIHQSLRFIQVSRAKPSMNQLMTLFPALHSNHDLRQLSGAVSLFAVKRGEIRNHNSAASSSAMQDGRQSDEERKPLISRECQRGVRVFERVT